MNERTLFRLKRLETQTELNSEPALRLGVLKRLPEDYVGERHVVIVEREMPASDDGSCAFEERPGPAPSGSDDGVPRVYLSEDEARI